MDWNSNLTLDKVALNDSSYNELWIGFDQMFGSFISSRSNDFARLGSAIGDNTHVTTAKIELYDRLALDVNNQEFFNGLKSNSSSVGKGPNRPRPQQATTAQTDQGSSRRGPRRARLVASVPCQAPTKPSGLTLDTPMV